MKKLTLLVSLSLLFATNLRAQQTDTSEVMQSKFIMPINLNAVKQMAQDDAKYLELISQFEEGGDDLGLYNISLIYFGWVFRPEYKGNLDVEYSPSEKLMTEGDFQSAWEEGVVYLKENPVSLITLQHVLSAGNALGKPKEELDRLMKRFTSLLQLIYLTGDGFTEQSAYKVISINDEHIFMQRILGVSKYANRIISNTGVDRFDVVTADKFDNRFLFIDTTLATHFGPKWEVPDDLEAETTE